MDEILELGGIPDEEDRRVVADEVVVAFVGVELDGEPPGVADGVGAAEFTGNRGEAHEQVGPLAGLEEVGLAVLGHVLGDLEEPVGTAALGARPARERAPG
jgi:hypothetical protein